MIKITVNKKEIEIPEETTVEKLLEIIGSQKSAVWINEKQALRAEYKTKTLMQGDSVRVLRIVAGG